MPSPFRSHFLWKLYAGYVVLIVLTTGITAMLVSGRIVRDSREDIRRSLEVRAVMLREIAAPALVAPGDALLQSRVARLAAETKSRLTVIGADGAVLADSEEDPARMDNHGTRPEVLDARLQGMGVATRFSDTTQGAMMYVAVRVDSRSGAPGYVRASLPLTTIEQQLTHLRGVILFVTLLTALAALLIGLFFARRFTSPLVSMTNLAQEFAAGDYRGRIHLDSNDEIGQLAAAFNAMAHELRSRTDTITRDRNQLLAILGGIVEGVIAVNHREQVVHMNAVAARILNVEPSTAVGRRIWELTRVREVSELIRRCFEENGEATGAAVIPGGDRSRDVDMVASRLLDAEGRTVGAVVVLHDVTRLRRLEAVRRDFVANASHELKTPITAIRGMVETMIEDEAMDSATQARFLGRVRDQATRLSALVSDLLTISRLESALPAGEERPVDLCTVIAESHRELATLADGAGVRVELELPAEPLPVSASREELRQVVDNLLDNAIKYTPSEGEVRIVAARDRDQARLRVSDTGIGFGPVHRDRIFERFYRVDQARSRELGGTGLGLSIVKNIVLGLQGTVQVDSSPGVGSTFEVVLPLAQSANSSPASTPRA